MKDYDPKEIEQKWQKRWEDEYGVTESSNKPKWYSLMEFPYPSGDGLHTGHVRGYTAMDVVSRKRRMQGYNVLYPIGWDAFGLPTENYAIKTGRDPHEVTRENSDTFRKQFKSLGMSFDWSREINTTDPKYYKWTQWLFLKFLEHGLAYKAKIAINWCPKDKIGLANEEVVDGKCERCGTPVEKREKEQWMLAITKYAERLIDDLETVDYPERVKAQQINWIGKSEGAEIEFSLKNISGQEDGKHKVQVFTTRPDTIFGATFLAISPGLAEKWLEVGWQASREVKSFVEDELERQKRLGFEVEKDKRGIDTGIRATNPANGEETPVWVVNYVLADVGTGAIMGVPAHDERDHDFAKKFGLEIRQVIEPKFVGEKGDGAVKSGLDFIKRNAVCAIVRNPIDDTYLCISWKKFLMNGIVTGGIEGDEDMVEAARREVTEETGYKNLKHLYTSPLSINTFFYHRVKEQNRHAHFHFVFFELENEEKNDVSEEESALHDIVWKSKSELKNFFTVFEGQFIASLLDNSDYIHTGPGILINSGKFDDKDSLEVVDDIIKHVGGEKKTTYKLRDWVFSRQRYWGEPIPVIHCEKCGVVPVPEKDLPVELPKVERYEPTDTGESPLAAIDSWVNVTCPKCGGQGKRETDTMPNWAGSSWYFYRYVDPHNNEAFASKEVLKYWMPIDWYNGGMEHTTLHLLYSRFWNKFLFDIGLVPVSEPYKKRTSHGLILAEGGVKMSKSLGNVINPDDIIKRFGADTLRLYEMFMGPFEQAIAWSEDALVGPRRFLEKVWRIQTKVTDTTESSTLIHQSIKKVSEDVESLGFNTAVSTLMILANDMEKRETVPKKEYEDLLKLLAPFAPHVTEEIWETLGHKTSIHTEEWPEFDPEKLVSNTVTLAVQVNGKVRASITLDKDASEESIREKVVSLPAVEKWLEGKKVEKIIVVPGKIVSIVT